MPKRQNRVRGRAAGLPPRLCLRRQETSVNRKKTRAPVVRGTRLRNDTGWLLRSRPLHAALVLVAGVQAVAVANGKGENKPGTQGAGLVRQAIAAPAPVTVIRAPATVVQAPLKVAAAPKSRKKAQGDRKLAVADELAAKYRRRGYNVSPSLARQIHRAALANRIDPTLAFGLVRTESAFKNSATSPVGAVGLTQLMPSTAKWMERGVTRGDLRNPE